MEDKITAGYIINCLKKVYDENPLDFAVTVDQSNHINYLTGKMLSETKGKGDPAIIMKLVKILVEEI